MSDLFVDVGLSDALDILVVAWLIYRSLLLLRGTRAARVLTGLIAVALLYALSELLKLHTLNFILETFSIYLVLGILILFQDDIRRALARMGNPLIGTSGRADHVPLFQRIGRACFRLADQGKGALIVFERNAQLDELSDDATELDAHLTEDLLVAIFQTSSPIHDGAAVVRGARIWLAGAFLPLSTRPDIDRAMGTRHRAAMGLAEANDCMVFVVSEERRVVSLVFHGELYPVDTPDELRLEVQRLLHLEQQEKESGDKRGLTGSFTPVAGKGEGPS